MNTRYLFFDVAHTLLEKQHLYESMLSVVKHYGYTGSLRDIQKIHRRSTEKTVFPPKTDNAFYRVFNTHLFHGLGIQCSEELLDRFSAVCRALPWIAYADTPLLQDIPFSKGIISNWDITLPQKVHDLLPYDFSPIIASAFVGVSKPDKKIFQIALKQAHVPPTGCWYIGDSLTLDIEPAKKLGMRTVLIDRYDAYPEYKGVRITSLLELPTVIG